MIKTQLIFTDEQAVKLLQEAGLIVVKEEYQDDYDIKLNFPVMIYKVKNPHNGNLEDVREVFKNFLIKRKDKLFLTADKLEIYELFENVKTENLLKK